MAWIAVVIGALVLAWALGPRPRRLHLDPALPPAPASAGEAGAWLSAHEAGYRIRPDNQARIQWAGKPGEASEWAIVYLHGYSASWREGAPVNVETARRYGANLLLTRLSGHGLVTEEPLLDLKAEDLWADAKLALVEGQALGRKVLLMATSSGAPLAIRLAADFPDRVQALVLYSPNIRIREPLAPLMSWPWGLQTARLVKHGLYNGWDAGPEERKYWYERQRLEGAVQLQRLLDAAYADGTLAKVRQPVFVGTYYKDEAHQDNTISVAATRAAFAQLGTPEGQKRYLEFPEAGRHVIACDLSSGAWKDVRAQTWKFLDEVVGMKP